jgi:tetratricopeptide (TPR) repeat protein
VCLRNLATLLEVRGQYEQSERYYREALKLFQLLDPTNRYPDGHPEITMTLSSLGRVLYAREQHEQAHEHLAQALRTQHRLLNRMAASALEADAIQYAATFSFTLSGMLSNARHLPNADAQTYALGWPNKAPVSRLLVQRHLLTLAGRHSSREVLQKHNDLIATRLELDALLTAPVKDAKVRDQQLHELNATIAKLQSELSTRLPTLKRLQELDELGPGDLARKLPVDAVFIDYWQYTHFEQNARLPGGAGWKYTDHYLVFVLHNGGKIVRVGLGPANAIDEAVATWRKLVA